jgi:hypothetical protein
VVLFLIGANVLASCVLTSKTKLIAQILVLCLFALIFVFFSGWLEVIKQSTDIEKIREKNFYSIFLEGIGANIIPATIGIILYSLFTFLTMILAQIIAAKCFGDISFFINELNKVASENGSWTDYIKSLDINQQYVIYGWNLCIMAGIILFNFVSLFYFPAIFYSEQKLYLRPLVSIWTGLKFLFKNFFSAIGISVFIYVLNIILTILNTLFARNMVLSVLFLLIHIYFLCYVVMLIFNYYEAKNNSSDRPDSIGENEVINTVSEED